jgi:xanthine dehydrogenase accessory factor
MNNPENFGSGPVEVEVYRRLAAMVTAGEQGTLVTVIATRKSTPRHMGSKMIVFPDGRTLGSVGGGSAEARVIAAAREVLADGECRRLELDLAGDLGVCGGCLEVFLEPVLQSDPFWVIGAGHVGRALVDLGRTLSFRFVLVDDRPEVMASLPSDLPCQRLVCGPEELAAHLDVPRRGAMLMANRNADLDAAYLTTVLEAEKEAGREFAFLGGIASRTKAGMLRTKLKGGGADPERLQRMQLPVGVAVGCETPAEIALSVLAEALAVLREVPLLTDEEGNPLGLPLQRRRSR